MNTIPLFLADAQVQQILASWRITDATLEQILIFGAIGLVTLLLLLWAFLLHRKRRRRLSHHHAHQHSSRPAKVPVVSKDEGDPSPPEKRRRSRRSRRRHRPRNPTLAETGGLPPIRPASPPESQP
jgi:hypothetical protein